jgi:hypothetical protein
VRPNEPVAGIVEGWLSNGELDLGQRPGRATATERCDEVATVPGGPSRRSRWTSFVADSASDPPRILHEEGNPGHRLRVEHDQQTLLIHLSDEDGPGWTVFAVERRSRKWAVAQGQTQVATARRAYTELHGSA